MPAESRDCGRLLSMWVNYGGDKAHIVECEVLGPLTDLAPGEQTSLAINAEIEGTA